MLGGSLRVIVFLESNGGASQTHWDRGGVPAENTKKLQGDGVGRKCRGRAGVSAWGAQLPSIALWEVG